MPADQQRHSKALVRTEIAGIAEAVISSYTLMMIEVGDLSGVAFDVMKYSDPFGKTATEIISDCPPTTGSNSSV